MGIGSGVIGTRQKSSDLFSALAIVIILSERNLQSIIGFGSMLNTLNLLRKELSLM
jgi:hypothetical protein